MYGIYVLYCKKCTWNTLKRSGKPLICEACGEPGEAEFEEHVGVAIANYSEKKSERVWQLARRHGFMVYQQSPRKYVVLKEDCCKTVSYRDEESRCFVSLAKAFEGTYQEAMKYIRDNTPNLPTYLRNKE